MLITIKGYITCRDGEKYYQCADNYAYNTKTNRFAISDGLGSGTFFPEIWSKILVDNFVALEGETKLSIESCQDQWLSKVTEEMSENPLPIAKSKFCRQVPGLATFVSLCFKERKWHATALGDSFLFFIPKEKENDFQTWIKLASGDNYNEWIENALESKPIDLGRHPDYYSSRKEVALKGKISEHEGFLESGTFYLITDGLAEWVLNEKTKAIEEIRSNWLSQEQFEKNVAILRKSHRLRDDDSTILIIVIDLNDNPEFEYMQEDVQNLQILIEQEIKPEIKEEKKSTVEVSECSKEHGNQVSSSGSSASLNHKFSKDEIKNEKTLSNEEKRKTKKKLFWSKLIVIKNTIMQKITNNN